MTETEPEQTPYLVTLAIVVPGFDPVDATNQAINRIAIEGLTRQQFRVIDTEDDSAYIVSDGEWEDDEPDDADFLTLDELLSRVVPALRAAEETSDPADDDDAITGEPTYVPGPPKRPVVDVELPEPVQPIKRGTAVENPMLAAPGPAPKKAKKGQCPRCKTEDVELPKNGVCADCNADIEG